MIRHVQQADDDLVKKAFRRLIQPAKGAAYTPAELIVLLNRFNYTAAGVPIKRLLRALTVCLENKVWTVAVDYERGHASR